MAKKKKYVTKPTSGPAKYLDPRLQAIVAADQAEAQLPAEFVRMEADGKPVVEVIAELKDPAKAVPGLTVTSRAGPLVTGTVEVPLLKAVAAHENVLRLSGGERVHRELPASIPEIRARPADLQAALLPGADTPTGQGVIVGVVDYGCDFLHQNFRRADGTTRVLFLWDQNGTPTDDTPAPAPFGYGREVTADQLNQALDEATARPAGGSNPYHPEDPDNGAYIHLGYRPNWGKKDPDDSDPSHGTHVMDIAAGNGRGTGTAGVAPEADLIFVHLYASQDNLLDDSRSSFASSVRLINAVDYIFRRAEELGRPAVVNLSLGTYGGPHDGTRDADRFFDTWLATPGRAVVVAAGNSHYLRTHASGEVSADAGRTLAWNIPYTGPYLDNELEVWYPGGGGELVARLTDPDGEQIGPLNLNDPAEQDVKVGTKLVMRVRHLTDPAPGNNDRLINVYLFPNSGLPTGNWSVGLTTGSDDPVPFHAWIDRSASSYQSKFAPADADPTHTLGSIACGNRVVAVGAYNPRGLNRPISSFTSEGPTRDGRQKPEVSGPGGDFPESNYIRAAWSLTHDRATGMPGTSMAAPHVAGVIALMLEQNPGLTTEQLRAALIQVARRNPPTGTGWHPRYGHGRIDAAAAVQAVTPTPPPPPPVDESPAAPAGLVRLSNGSAAPLPGPAGVLEQMALVVAEKRLRMRFQVEIEPSD